MAKCKISKRGKTLIIPPTVWKKYIYSANIFVALCTTVLLEFKLALPSKLRMHDCRFALDKKKQITIR